MKRLLLGLACVLLSAAALADNADTARKQAVGSMLVTGSIDVLSDGKVGRYDIDQSSKLPPAVVQLIDKTVSQWQFEPVLKDGRPVIARSKMSLRVVANPVAGGKYAISISGADFGQQVAPAGASFTTDQISEKSAMKPSYPRDAVVERVTGTVYVLLKVDRAGRVEEASAQQVNLHLAASASAMVSYRRMLAVAATSALKHWTFNLPSTGTEASENHWLVRVPVNFSIDGDRVPGYGQWDVYVPGPLQPVPWIKALPEITNDKVLTKNVDTTPTGGSLLSAGGLQLMTRINGI